MSIQITLKTIGLNITANIKDTALATVMNLIHENRDDSAPSFPPQVTTNANASGGSPALESEDSIKAALRERGAAELLNFLRWESYPEKILLLGAWYEAKSGTSPWRSADMEEVFMQAKEKAPANFPRDIKAGIKSGWINAVTPRTYSVTRTGWNKISQSLSATPAS